MSASLPTEVQKELETYIAAQVEQIPELKEDAKDAAEYLVLLINNGKTPEQAFEDLSSIFTSEALPGIVKKAYEAVNDYHAKQAQPAAPVPQISEPAPQPQQTSQPQAQGQTQDGDSMVPDNEQRDEMQKSIPTRPAAYAQRGIHKNSGRGGRFANGPRSFAMRNPEAMTRALNLSHAAGSDTYINGRGQVKKKARCQQFPHCPNRDCEYSHPTKPCFNYQNGTCPNPPGTCNFLHPDQDVALMAELEKTKNEYLEKKNQREITFAQNATGIVLCKFGVLCTNQQCPFGHPTPANEDAKVIAFEWCPANLGCTDASCTKAHSSLSKIKEVIKPQPSATATSSQPKPAQEKSLDPCKFGQNCTNRFCKFRHATTKTLCRDGAECTRIDCFFSHPINEECRFGDNCKNPNCLFKHPSGKPPAAGIVPAKSLSWTKTNERQFAVPDHEVLEQAPPQEG